MKKLLLLTKTLLVVALLGVGTSVWGTPTIIKTYDFYTASTNAASEASISYSGSTTINKIVCDNLTGDWAGIAIQGSGSWYLNRGGKHAYDGYYNNNGGGRLFALLDLKEGDIVHITANGGLATTAINASYDSDNSTAGTDCYYTMTANGNFAVSVTRYYQILVVTVTRDLADLENPTYEITGANGNERQVTLNCLTDGAAIKYNTTNDKSAAGWTTYSTPFYTSEATLYAYSEKSATTSDVITITTGAGTTLKLNTPVISKTAYADGNYTISISSDQSTLAVAPASPSVKYSIDGGSAQTYSAPFSVAAGKTITSWVENTGYTNSDEANLTTAVRPNYGTKWTQDYTQVTSTAGTGVQAITLSSESFTVNETNFYNIEAYGETPTVVSLNTNVGLNTATGFGLRCNSNNSGIIRNTGGTGYIGIKNLVPGEYIVITTNSNSVGASYGATLQEGMCTSSEYYFLATGTEASISVPAGTYNYIKTISVLEPSVTISTYGYATFSCTSPVDLTGITEATAYIATAQNGDNITMKAITGTVAANTGLVFKSKNGGATSFNVPITASGTYYDLGTNPINYLFAISSGYDLGTSSTGTNYVLSVQEINEVETVVWAPIANNSNKAPVTAGHAALWIPATNPSRSLRMVFGDNSVTGIGDATRLKDKGQKTNDVFNLNGQRVKKAAKGLYIVNGKKYIK